MRTWHSVGDDCGDGSSLRVDVKMDFSVALHGGTHAVNELVESASSRLARSKAG